jgi:ABC-2 type transport system permease protein
MAKEIRVSVPALEQPGRGLGLLDVFRNNYLLLLLVRKETRLRYRGSILGWLWSYVKPAAQFAIFYLAMGEFMGLNRSMPNFAIFLFSGLIIVNFFAEAFDNATRSIVVNSSLVKKIYLPREMFPVSSVIVSFVNFFPQLLLLIAVASFVGWHPSWIQIAALPLAILIAGLFATGLGLMFCAVNVALRDAQNVVELIVLFTIWLSPVFYHIDLVARVLPEWLFVLYQLNPVTAAVRAFHFAIWMPTTDQSPAVWTIMGPNALTMAGIGLLGAIGFVFLGQLVFRRMEKDFAQDL